ncbi:hypothetical protein [Magnetofaba australis]|nr:hypothetical protein [Magnetofaba australis]
MKSRFYVVSRAAALALLSGCAGMTQGPDAARLQSLPVVAYGQTPQTEEYVTHFAKGSDAPMAFTVQGTLLQQPQTLTGVAKMGRDLWVYRQWMSYDRQRWIKGGEGIAIKVDVQLPQWGETRPSRVVMTLDARNPQ